MKRGSNWPQRQSWPSRPPDDKMLTCSHEVRLEDVTRQALIAAEQGRWDVVSACYFRRAAWLVDGTISADLARRLAEMDSVVFELARVARAAVGQAIGDLEGVVRRLRILEGHVNQGRDNGERVDRII